MEYEGDAEWGGGHGKTSCEVASEAALRTW